MDRESVEKRPAILVVGSPNVGKRTLLSRLLKVDFEDASESDASPELSVHGFNKCGMKMGLVLTGAGDKLFTAEML